MRVYHSFMLEITIYERQDAQGMREDIHEDFQENQSQRIADIGARLLSDHPDRQRSFLINKKLPNFYLNALSLPRLRLASRIAYTTLTLSSLYSVNSDIILIQIAAWLRRSQS